MSFDVLNRNAFLEQSEFATKLRVEMQNAKSLPPYNLKIHLLTYQNEDYLLKEIKYVTSTLKEEGWKIHTILKELEDTYIIFIILTDMNKK
jgi:hypothetical protein